MLSNTESLQTPAASRPARKRGRPRKNGLQPAWMLDRAVIALYAFQEARRIGLKYESAIQEAIETVKKRHPKMRIGPRRVKQILAEWQPKAAPLVWTVTKGAEADLATPEMQRSIQIVQELSLPGTLARSVFTLGVGPRPVYQR